MVCPEIKWVFAKISDFLISIPLQTDGVNLRYFKDRFVDFKSHYSKIKRSKHEYFLVDWAIMLSLECMINWEPFG